MANLADPGQAPTDASVAEALSRLWQAVRCFDARGVVDVAAALDGYRALRPAGHARAADEAPDLDFLEAAFALGGASLLGASQLIASRGTPRTGIVVEVAPLAERDAVELRLPPSPHSAMDAFALTAGLAVEASKVARLLDGVVTEEDALLRISSAAQLDEEGLVMRLGGDRGEAVRALSALLAPGEARTVRLATDGARPDAAAPFDGFALEGSTHDAGGPLFVVAGASDRLHDLVSPYVRRLRGPLSRLAASSFEDALYDALWTLFSEAPAALEERLEAEARDGISPIPGALVVRFDALDPALADARSREDVRALKRSRARAVLCDAHPRTLGQTAGRRHGDRLQDLP